MGPSANARDWNRGGHRSVVLNTMQALPPSPAQTSRRSHTAVEWPKQKSEKVTLETDPRLRSSNQIWVYRRWSCGAQRKPQELQKQWWVFCLESSLNMEFFVADPALSTVAVTT